MKLDLSQIQNDKRPKKYGHRCCPNKYNSYFCVTLYLSDEPLMTAKTLINALADGVNVHQLKKSSSKQKRMIKSTGNAPHRR